MSLALIISSAGILLYEFTFLQDTRTVEASMSEEGKMQLASLLFTLFSCSEEKVTWIHTADKACIFCADFLPQNILCCLYGTSDHVSTALMLDLARIVAEKFLSFSPDTGQSPARQLLRAIDASVLLEIEQLAQKTLRDAHCGGNGLSFLMAYKAYPNPSVRRGDTALLSSAVRSGWDADPSNENPPQLSSTASPTLTVPLDYTSPATPSSPHIEPMTPSPRGGSGVWRIFSFLSFSPRHAQSKSPVPPPSTRFVNYVIEALPPFTSLRDISKTSSLIISTEDTLTRCPVLAQRLDSPVQIVSTSILGSELWAARAEEVVCIYAGGRFPMAEHGDAIITLIRVILDVKVRATRPARGVAVTMNPR